MAGPLSVLVLFSRKWAKLLLWWVLQKLMVFFQSFSSVSVSWAPLLEIHGFDTAILVSKYSQGGSLVLILFRICVHGIPPPPHPMPYWWREWNFSTMRTGVQIGSLCQQWGSRISLTAWHMWAKCLAENRNFAEAASRTLYFYIYLVLSFWAIPSGAQDFLPALFSGITLGGSHRDSYMEPGLNLGR